MGSSKYEFLDTMWIFVPECNLNCCLKILSIFLNRTIPESCETVRNRLVEQMNLWQGDDNCGQVSDDCPSLPCGQNCKNLELFNQFMQFVIFQVFMSWWAILMILWQELTLLLSSDTLTTWALNSKMMDQIVKFW